MSLHVDNIETLHASNTKFLIARRQFLNVTSWCGCVPYLLEVSNKVRQDTTK